MKRVAIIQSNYIPWRGYFHLVDSVSDFVFFDEVQYTRRDWRNRNQIKSPNGPQWLTIPVQVKGKFEQKISETVIAESDWREKHLKAIEHSYARANAYDEMFPVLQDLYARLESDLLSTVNFTLTKGILDLLQIPTRLHQSSDFSLREGKTERLLAICEQLGADCYVSGPSAKEYMQLDLFRASGIEVEFFDYGTYGAYPQLHGEFVPNLSIVDLLLNAGKDAKQFISPER